MDENTERPFGMWSDVLAGAGLGLLLGTLVALSKSEVVVGVVGALTGVLAIFMGLDAASGTMMGALRVNGARIGALGLATVLGLGIGLYARVNNVFMASPEAQIQRWNVAFPEDPTLAKQMMVFERSGFEPSRLVYGTAPPPADITVARAEGSEIKSSVLFSTLSEFDVCTSLNPARLNPEDLLAAYSLEGAPAALPKIGASIAALPEAEQVAALAAAHRVLCILQREETP